MHLKCMVILFVLSLASCKCGLLNWFTGWTDELNPRNSNIKCRERREPEENGIKPDITKSTTGKPVSLMDIEGGKVTTKSDHEPKMGVHEGNSKAKRCPKSPLVGAARRVPKFFSLVKRDLTPQERCDACRNRPTCKLLGACAQCNEDCKGIAIFTDDLLTPWTNQSVGMGSPKTGDIFSKTLYPVSTFREGETKEIVCRIVGITDTSDIETVTIWVTTFTNAPPKSLSSMFGDSHGTSTKTENTPEQSLRTSGAGPREHNQINDINQPLFSNVATQNGRVSSPEFQSRFNEINDEDDSAWNGKIKSNPDVIEGPPSFLRSKNILSATHTDENDSLKDTIPGQMSGVSNEPIIVQPKEFLPDDDDDDDIVPFSAVQSLPPTKESTTIKNVVKPTLLSRLRELATSRINKLSEIKAGNENPSIKLPDESNDQIAKINDAIEEVKTMVQNIQEASKTSDQRLLGASPITDPSEDIEQNNIAAARISSLPSHQIRQVLPGHVVDNLKKVNHYFINRAQDVLDTIKSQEKEDKPLQLAEEDNIKDEHSVVTKNTITNLKKMPQYLLDKFKETLNGFENTPSSNVAKDVDFKNIKENTANGDIKINERFDDNNVNNKIDSEGTLENSNIKIGSSGVSSGDDRDDSLVGMSEQDILENETLPKLETSTTKQYKSKLEKYLDEVKEKRQRMYSPDKYLKSPSIKSSKMIYLPEEEELLNSVGPSTIQTLNPEQNAIENNSGKGITTDSNMLPPKDLERQRELLRQKLRKFIKDVKLKTSSSFPLTKIEETTSPLPKEINSNIGLVPADNQDSNNNIKSSLNPESSTDPVLRENFKVQELNSPTLSENILTENTHQEVNNIFLPTIPTLTNNTVNQNTPIPNRFQKYLEDLRAKQSELLKPKKPIEETLGQPKISFNQRMSDEISNLNNKIKNDMKNVFEPPSGVFKKDILKERLQNYISSLRKPMESNLVPDLLRKSSETQREELNSLKIKLENLLKAKEPTPPVSLEENPLVSKGKPILDPSNEPGVDKNIVPTMSRIKATDVENNDIVGNMQEINGETPLNSRLIDNQDVDLQNKDSVIWNNADNLNWTHNLGKIVQSSSQPKDIFFIGTGIKLPLQVKQGPDGSMDLSVDLEKLCSCYNATCPKNHTAIEETVSEILKKEAELNEQLEIEPTDVEETVGEVAKKDSELDKPLQNETLDDVKINPLFRNRTKLVNIPTNKGYADIPRFVGKRIFRRSSDIKGLGQELTTIKTMLEKLKEENEENINNVLKDNYWPKLPTLDSATNELTNLGKKVQDSFTNSVQQLKNDVKELEEELGDSIVAANQKSGLDLPDIPTYNSNWFEDNLNEIKENMNELSNDVLEKLEHKNNLNNLINQSGLKNRFMKTLKPNTILKGMLKSNGLNEMNLPTRNPLSVFENQANDIIRKLEQQNTIYKLREGGGLTNFQLPKIPIYQTTKDPLAFINQFQEKLEKSIPAVHELQNKMNEINDDIIKITDAYPSDKANILENKLNELDNEVKKYYEKNEKLLAEESKKLLGGHNGEIVEKEVNILNKIISWIKSLASGIIAQ